MRIFTGTLALLLTAAAAHAGDLIPTDSRYGPLRIALHKVDVTVDNQLAMTRVEQVFANDNRVQLEAHYVFPVPRGASIIDFSMTINGKLMRGELLEKERARSIYEGIVRKSKDPGLLEHVGANIFRVRVFPVLANSTQKIELTYVERVNYDKGTCRYVYPLRTPGDRHATRADRFELRWRLASKVPIRRVSCVNHPANVAKKTESEAELTWSARQVDLSKDIEIEYRIERHAVGMDLVAQRPDDDEGTFLLLITPAAKAPTLPKDMTFVFDTSGSMAGEKIRQARAALRFCLSKLGPADRFNILAFSTDVTPFSPAHVPATEKKKASARRFIHRLDASGGTNVNDALQRALRHKADASRPHLIVFLTDGRATSGVTAPVTILQNVLAVNRSNVRIFTFGVGKDLNRSLLEDLADATGAVSVDVDETEDIEVKVSRLQKKIAAPIITELSIDWGDAAVGAVHPKRLGDLYAGTQLMVTGRYREAGSFEVTLRGRLGPRRFALKRKIVFPKRRDDSPAVPYLWAMRKVATLLDDIRRLGENAEIVREVITLSRKYRIATPYTSFLVLESEAAYDRHGVDRRSAKWKPPAKPVARKPRPASEKVFTSSALKYVYKKDVESDHNETSDEEEFRSAKGDSVDFVSDKPFQGKGTFDVIGGGGGGGGRYGGRLGGKQNLVARGGGDSETEDAVLASLKWLSRHQNPDGSWSTQAYVKHCRARCAPNPGHDDFNAGATGLSLLAFLGAGYSHLSKDTYDGICFGDVVRKGLQWMMAHQDPEGCIGSRNAQKYTYNHAICALAMSEAFGLTGSRLFKDQAQKAIDFLLAAQNPGKGWRYSFKSGDSDTSVTGWAMMAFKSAEISGLQFTRSAYDGSRAWIDEVTDEKGRAGYTRKGTGKVFIPGVCEAFDHHETLTAIAVLSRIFMDKNKSDPRLAAGCEMLVKDRPRWDGNATDFYYWYWASNALFHYDGPSGPRWKAWNGKMKRAIVPNQNGPSTGCKRGSWEPVGRWCPEGGRVYATAINALTLQVYYRFANVFGVK